MKLAALNAHATAARLRVDALEQELAAAYLAALRSAGRKAASRFRSAAMVAAPAVTAASNPRWVQPDPGELVDQAALAAQAQKKAGPIQERALKLAVPVGISFDVSNPLAQQFLAGLADRSERILAGYSGEIAAAVGDAYAQGLSVPKAAQLIRARAESASEVQAALLARSDLVSIANGGSLLAAQMVADASEAAGEGGAATFKTWVTAGDERVRDTHAEADGQTVPLDQPFDVGGESLMYPGDVAGSLEETANCRCVNTYSDSMTAASRVPVVALSSAGTMDETLVVTPAPLTLRDFHLTAAAGEPTRWQATLLVEDEPTEDGRMIAADAATWRALPLPLAILDDSSHSDGGEAPVCGRIDQIWRAGSLVQAAGVFDTGPVGVEAERLVRERMITGISCDGICTQSEIIVTRRDDAEEDQELVDEVDQVVGGDPVIDEGPVAEEDLDYLFVATEYVIMGATICPAGAIAQARIAVVADASGEETWKVAAPFEPSRCEVSPVPAAGDELSRAAALAIVHKGLDALAASGPLPEQDDSQRIALGALTASVDSFAGRLDVSEEGLSEKLAAIDALAGKTSELERALDDRLRSMDARQEKILLQFAATSESFDALAARLGVLETMTEELTRLRDLVERKPRQVEFMRDDKGRLAGLVEG